MRAYLPTATVVVCAALLLLAACQKEGVAELESEAAVEAAIRTHLSTRPGLAMDKMEMEVRQVEFKGDTAEADVVLHVKDGEGEMPFHYTLRRQGDQWVVERGGGNGTGEPPPGHPPVAPLTGPPEKLPRTGHL